MIIQSLLDTDLYKFTMMQVVLHHFPGAQVEYRFKCRNADVDLRRTSREIRDEIRELCSAALHARASSTTCAAGASSRATSSTCWASSSSTSASSTSSAHRGLAARSTSRSRDRGCTRSCSRCRCSRSCPRSTTATCIRSPISPKAAARLATKIDQINAVPDPEFRIADYGTRRRFSRAWQDEVIVDAARRASGRSSSARATCSSRSSTA